MNKPKPREYWPPPRRADVGERPPPQPARRVVRLGPIALIALTMLAGSIGSLVTIALLGSRLNLTATSPAPNEATSLKGKAQPPAEIDTSKVAAGNRLRPSRIPSAPSTGSEQSAAALKTDEQQADDPVVVAPRKSGDSPTPTVVTAIAPSFVANTAAADGLVVVTHLVGRGMARGEADKGRTERKLKQGDVIREGDEISVYDTQGWENGRIVRLNGRMEISVNGHNFVRIDQSTTLKIVRATALGASDRKSMQFIGELNDDGRVWVNAEHTKASKTSFILKSFPAEVATQGARFMFRKYEHPTSGVETRVYEGRVTETLTDVPITETLSAGWVLDGPVVGGWHRPEQFDPAAEEQDDWVRWNFGRDAAAAGVPSNPL